MELCTLDDLKAWLSLSADDASGDPMLERLIEATSADFLRAIGRPALLAPAPPAHYTEVYQGDDTRTLTLRQWPVTGVTSVTDDAGVVLTASADGIAGGWRLVPEQDPEKSCTVELIPSTTGATAAIPDLFDANTKYSVVYDAGYATVPADIAQAVIDWAAYRYRSRGFIGQQSKHMQSGETITFEGMVMPRSTKAVVEDYRRDLVRM
jgi:hypothetical protein